MRACVKCKRRRPEGAFAVTWNRAKQRRTKAVTCRICTGKTREKRKEWRRTSSMKVQYGITREGWEQVKKRAKYKCEVCGAAEHTLKRGLLVDHCHTNGHVRGALCDPCNKSLGGFKDSPKLLRAAAKYIEKRRNAHD